MANTTFSGPVRSQNGFQMFTKNATTGTITVTSGDKMAEEAVGSAGIEGTAGVYITTVVRDHSDTSTNVNIVKSTIMIDLTGLKDGGTAGDIIGKDGSGVAYIARVTTANQGTVFGVTMTCLEAPAAADQYLYLVSQGTGDATYTAGRFLIEIIGFDTAS